MMKNADMVRGLLRALYTTAGRRTTQSFAVAVIGAIVKTLEQRYDFLKYIYLKGEGRLEEAVLIDSDLESIDPSNVARAIETVVQVVYMDLKEKAGLYFIKELQRNAGEAVISSLKEAGVDLELLQIQQHYLYRRQSRSAKDKQGAHDPDKAPIDNVSLLGYSLDSVSNWEFDSNNRECVIYGKNGEVLDKLNLDNLVKKYIGELTDEDGAEIEEIVEKTGTKVTLEENEVELLKIIQKSDIDASTASAMLHVNQKDLELMIRRLVSIEFLHYISSNEVALTEIGIDYLKKKKEVVKNA